MYSTKDFSTASQPQFDMCNLTSNPLIQKDDPCDQISNYHDGEINLLSSLEMYTILRYYTFDANQSSCIPNSSSEVSQTNDVQHLTHIKSAKPSQKIEHFQHQAHVKNDKFLSRQDMSSIITETDTNHNVQLPNSVCTGLFVDWTNRNECRPFRRQMAITL